MKAARLRIGILATHPIQYYAPWYRALARDVDLEVFFSHRQSAEGQAAAGFGVPFEWDVPLLEGYESTFLRNVAGRPAVDRFFGCRTPEIAGRIREGRFDAFIVHGWSTWSYWQAILACWRSGTPVFVRGDSTLQVPRAWWRRAAKEPVYRWFVPRFDGYLTVGARAKDYLLHYGADARSCFPSPHAVDNDWFRERAKALASERAAIRERFGLSDTTTVFLFAGRFIARKSPDVFVHALAQSAAGGANIAGLIVGDGPLRSHIERLAVRLDAPVRFAGFLNQSEMVGAYVAADVLIVPSEWETWGLVVNEAMACGRPAIVSDGVPCAGDLVLAGKTGEVFAVGDVDALAGHVTHLAADDSYRKGLSEEATRRVQAFSVRAAADGVLDAVAAVTGHKDRANPAAWSSVSVGRAER